MGSRRTKAEIPTTGRILRILLPACLILSGLACALAASRDIAGVPPTVEAVIHRRVQTLERALLQRDPSVLEAWLAPDARISGYSGETGRKVLAEALRQLRQVESLRVRAILTAVPPYRVSVRMKAWGLASDREITLSAMFRFVDIRLFDAEVRVTDAGQRILVAWEPAVAPLPERISSGFDLTGRLMALEGITVNGRTGCLILDTGATTLLLNSRRFADSFCPGQDGGVMVGAGGCAVRADRVWIRDFAWEGYRLACFETPATDMTDLEVRLGRPVLGLLGARPLRPYDLTVDYRRCELVLHRLDGAGNRLRADESGAGGGLCLPFELDGSLAVLPLTVGDVCLRLGLDSGAAANVLDREAVERIDASCRRALPGCTYQGVGPARQAARRIRLHGVRLGPAPLLGMDAVVGDLSLQRERLGVSVDGLLGYEFFRRQPVTINYVKQQMRLHPQAAQNGVR